MDWLNDHAWAAWLGLAAMFGVAEMFSLDLIFLMLAVGAMGGVVAGAFDAPLALQVLVALGTSLATLTLLRPPLVARLHGGPELRLGTGKLIGTQGVVTAQITGRAAHAGLEPEKGISALLIAADILGRLPLGRIDEETTANIGRMEGGLKRNIIPEQAFLDGEFRSRSNEKLADVERKFRGVFEEVASRFPEAKIDLDIVNTYQAYNVDPNSDAVAIIGKALAEMGLKPILETTGGGSDANVFIEKGISAIPVGIGVRDFHTTWETAVIAEVLQGAQMCQGIIKGA